jgi:hypothetical protein
MSDGTENGNTGATQEAQAADGAAAKETGAGNSNGELTLLGDDNPDTAGTAAATKEGERPSFLPESAWDADKRAVKPEVLLTEFEKADKIAKDLRVKLGKGLQKPPEKAEDYKLPQLTDEADKPIADLLKADDPFVKGLGPVFHKHGISQTQYEGIMKDAGHLLKGLAGDNNGDASEPTDEEKAAWRKDQYDRLGPNAPRMVAEVASHMKMLADQGMLSEQQTKYIKAFAGDAEGVKILNVFRTLMGGEAIPMNTDSIGMDGLPPDAEIAAVIGGKEYMAGDPATHRKVENWLDQRRQAGRPERLAF